MIIPAQRSSANLAISRLGKSCSILEPVGGTTNDYGKKAGVSFDSLATESVVRVYDGGGTEPSPERHTGGRLPADSPLLIFRADSVVQEGFRVTYGDDTYEIDSLADYPTHSEATTTLVT